MVAFPNHLVGGLLGYGLALWSFPALRTTCRRRQIRRSARPIFSVRPWRLVDIPPLETMPDHLSHRDTGATSKWD